MKRCSSRNSNRTKTSGWTSLPVELVAGVLSWLPAEDVARLQLVCRQWRDVLRDPAFAALWGPNGGSSTSSLLLFHSARELRDRGAAVRGRNPFTSFAVYRFFPTLPKRLGLRKRKASSCKEEKRLQQVPPSLKSWLLPKDSLPLLSHGGVLLCYAVESGQFYIGNPLTHHWLQIPPLQLYFHDCTTVNLTTYLSDGRMFFKLWLDPYWFDSAVGIWTLPRDLERSVWMRSNNTVCIGGVHYGLGECLQFDAVVLLEIEDMVASSDAKWIYAWNDDDYDWYYVSMMEIGGEVGMVATNGQVLVLDREVWEWKEISRMPQEMVERGAVDTCQGCFTHGHLAFLKFRSRDGVVVFDCRSLSWEWLAVDQIERGIYLGDICLVELNYTAEANINTASEELRKTCASRYRAASFCNDHSLPFEELATLFQSGMSWADIGATAVDRKWGVFGAKKLKQRKVLE